MILLNTTFSVDANIAAEFLSFINQVYIPLAQEDGFYGILVTELRTEAHDNALTGQKCRTFALQMRAASNDMAESFRNDVLPQIYQQIGKEWGMGVAMFESTLDVIHDPYKR